MKKLADNFSILVNAESTAEDLKIAADAINARLQNKVALDAAVAREQEQKDGAIRLSAINAEIANLISEGEALATKLELTWYFDSPYGSGEWFESGEWNSSSSSC